VGKRLAAKALQHFREKVGSFGEWRKQTLERESV
jgi:hypothetical protein